LEVEDLKMYFSTKDGDVHAVDDVSFTLDKGEVLGIAGESGSGKTSIALSILRLLPTNARFLEGKVLLDGEDLRLYSDTQLRQSVRWKRISLVSQAAMNALNPVFRIGDQIKEAISSHTEISDVVATSMVKKLLEEVGISQDRYSSYPHELSGGMKQRTIIAMALALDPDIVIADEPTTALDVIVQAQILVLLRSLQRSKRLAMILITHDLSLVAEMCDKVAILYAGQIVEYGSASKIFHDPRHPYTIGLIKAFPNLEAKKQRLLSIPGAPPDLVSPPSACRFAPRCPYATSKCTSEAPLLEEIDADRLARCWYAKEIHI
jgi:oligopeptide/dipeptide ABC transporter ATP-binding protein